MRKQKIIKRKIQFKLNQIIKGIYLKIYKPKLTNDRPFIISNNCWAGIVYKDLDIPYQTPFVNMYMFAPCYMELLKDLSFYLSRDLQFVQHSKYPEANANRNKQYYPIGVLGEIEIHFIHYSSEDYTYVKWKERLKRINISNMIVIMSERDRCTPELIKEFDRLDYSNKVCFTIKEYNLRSSIYLKSFRHLSEIPGADEIVGHTYWRLPLVPFLNKVKCP
jgi:uncharacterized protein (DUF1919 family)